MTRTLAIHVPASHGDDELFNPASRFNRDDCLIGWRALRDEVVRRGGRCVTHDVAVRDGIVPDAVLFMGIGLERGAEFPSSWRDVERWVVLFECDVIDPANWSTQDHRRFSHLFTWDVSWVDGRRWHHIRFPVPIPDPADIPDAGRERIAVMIAANKRATHPLELYSARLDTIRWFERYAPADLRLYGIGWDERPPGFVLDRIARRVMPSLGRIGAARRPSWHGVLDSKTEATHRATFSITYENARDIPGYVTEKVFDALFGGTIPVYWGAPDLASLLPEELWIDRTSFTTHEALHEALKGMDDLELQQRRDAIRDWIASGGAAPHSARSFACAIADRFLQDPGPDDHPEVHGVEHLDRHE